MIVSWNWLTQYVRLDMPVEVLTERLALSGLNHESTAEVGGDLAIDLEVTSNRPDCLGHLGVAREIAVLFDRPFHQPQPDPTESGEPVAERTAVSIEVPELCPRFTARVISGVQVKESPWWLRKRLESIGVRPISSIVDITNYVMFECGQPLHAYDLDRLVERRLIVRRAHKGEILRAINNRDYELSPEMLVIADALRPVGLAGVMGGAETEIQPDTVNVLIEAAQFDPLNVRRTARALSLFSPSSYRFERPLDPDRTLWANHRCAQLILEIAGGTLHPGAIDIGNPPAPRAPIRLRLDQIPRVLGIDIPADEVQRILRALGLEEVTHTSEAVTCQPPSWRADLEREIDLIEEVARIHGYEHIPENRPVPLVRSARGPRERVEAEIRAVLPGLGFDEAVTFSLVSDTLCIPADPADPPSPLRVDHSSRKKENALRQSLIPSLLAARAYNAAHGVEDAWLFEIANAYLAGGKSGLPKEPTRLALVSGHDFLGLKAVLEGLLHRLHADQRLECRPGSSALFMAGRCAELHLGPDHLGWLGEIDPSRRQSFGLRETCSGAELDLNVLIAHATAVPQYSPLPSFPAVTRDLSLVVPVNLPWGTLAETVRAAAGPWLEELDYFSTFQADDIPQDAHSLHFGMKFRSPERTLTSEEVEGAVQRILEACASRYAARLRA